ncbi:MAG: sigma-54 dependent transcriptional regulator [Rikenellaceae bacterium]
MIRILVVDDERAIRNTLKEVLEYENYVVDTASSGSEALDMIGQKSYNLVITDIFMDNMSGIELFNAVLHTKPDLPFIIISGFATVESAVELTKAGAYYIIKKPLDMNDILKKVRGALDKVDIVQQTAKRKRSNTPPPISKKGEIIGNSIAIQNIKEIITKVAASGARVLIVGENGTGKELVARSLHALSRRSSSPLIEVNCAAMPADLIESEMFGHEKGSFTGAIRQKKGKFELADGGTLFLDEIGDMSLSAQAKVLRALQEHKITPVGCDKDIQINVRVIAATNKNLQEEIKNGNFREDLYHRLSVVIVKVPPLRDRLDDIPLLATHFIEQLCEAYDLPLKQITPDAIELLQQRSWSGNVRELANVIERLIIFSDEIIDRSMVETYVDN